MHVVEPGGIGVLHILVFAAVRQNIVVGATEIGVARSLDGAIDVEATAIVTVNHMVADMVTAARATVNGGRRYSWSAMSPLANLKVEPGG